MSLWLNFAACFASLAVALAFLLGGARGRLGIVTPLAALSMFAWNFASLAHDVSHTATWEVLDLTGSPLSVALLLDVVLTFAGRVRAQRSLLLAGYGWFGAISASNLASFFVPALADWPDSQPMAGVFLVGLGLALALGGGVLFVHQRVAAPGEARRTRVLLCGLLLAGVVGSSTLLNNVFPLFPTSAAPAALVAVTTLAFVIGRAELVGVRIEPAVWWVAVALSAAGCGGSLAVFLVTDPQSSAQLFGALTVLLAVVVPTRELARSRARRREHELEDVVRGRLSDQLVHDLRNPLAALKGAQQFLAAEPEVLNEGQRSMVGLMGEEIERLGRLIDEHHRMARALAHRTPSNVRELLERLAASARVASERHPVEVEVEADAEAAELDADLVLLALENLIRNARDALPEGGAIRVQARRDGRHLVLTVHDDGVGLEPRTRERAFDELFTTKRAGSGLGLAFVRRVARAHHGDATIESEPGRGTTVTLRLRA